MGWELARDYCLASLSFTDDLTISKIISAATFLSFAMHSRSLVTTNLWAASSLKLDEQHTSATLDEGDTPELMQVKYSLIHH